MFRTYLKNRKNRKGFSLIELLIVIAIIGIIATIAIPLLLSARNNAINEKARNSLRSFASAEVAYYAANGSYGDATDLNAPPAPQTSYCDSRFTAGDLGQGITFTLNSADTAGFSATCTGATMQYDVTETGEITETAL